MYAETKRRTYLQIGAFLGAMGALLTLVGLYYVNNITFVYGDFVLQRAATLWGGILLVCFAVRSATLSYPASRFSSDGMWDTCSAVFASLFSLLISGAIVGITLWAHVPFFRNIDPAVLEQSNELVNLIAILLMGVLSMLASLVGCIIACFPLSDGQPASRPGGQYAMENQGYSKH